jgi:ribose transport system ATP-binding protein
VGAKTVLEMKGICKAFPGVQALQDVNLEVREGEVHVLLGENGAGKSTLIKILSDAYTKDAGHILLNGKKVQIDSPRQAQELGIAVIYQEFNLVPNLSVAENLFLSNLPGRNGMVDWSKLYGRAEEVLRGLDLQIDVKAPVKKLSVAHQQMVEIAKALCVNARIIVMDEPTSALTRHEIAELFETIRALKETGVSIIYISHRLEEVAEVGDRVTVLRDGQNVGTVEVGLTSLDTLIRMMVGRELRQKFPKIRVPIGSEMLRVEGLSREGVLHDVSFSLHAGEILGLFGLVGAGRTELAQAIFGAVPIDDGEVYVGGERVPMRSPKEAIDNGLGFLPEDRKAQGLIENMSVVGNITLAALDKISPRTFRLSPHQEQQVGGQYVEKLRIKTPSMQQWVKFLSGGNQQKVIVAKWLCSGSRVLIFDEPTRGIDVGAKVEVYQLMNELIRDGAGIIMISSELPEILGMSDRILVMRQGRIVAQLRPEEATQETLLQFAMGGNACEGRAI